ncbi:hypothetical protein OAV36_02565 [Flavobacteriales bacterium]|jgi:hypothetical protein|nr:hypothetical protein [Flavobacteriales bacterium]MDC3395105.1 hypothetical protein [Flavobacteriales bacterium]MDG1348466.1 hypothetical protein [Flavobacteriales bacterium]
MKKISFIILTITTSTIFAQVNTVYNPITERTWMDRNLGATQVATAFDDANAYGDLYQWGRNTDGHQIRTSSTTSVLSAINSPNHSDFILGSSDWLTVSDDNLWQGVNGINNPCPLGFRLPTEAECESERLSWTSNDAAGAFASPLKLTIGGARSRMSGAIGNVGTFVGYRTSSLNGTQSRLFGISLTTSLMADRDRADGNCVRCIQDESSTSIDEIQNPRTLIKTVDILGKETKANSNTTLFYIYDDGTVEKRIVID